MSEIKIGEYVRTKKQGISKIRYINDNRPINKYSGETNRYDNEGDEYFMPIKTTEITKHSFNIIDLIEVGDMVNKHKVLNVCLDNNYKYVDIDCDKPSYESYLFEEQIETILTHEQYENNCYKVVE